MRRLWLLSLLLAAATLATAQAAPSSTPPVQHPPNEWGESNSGPRGAATPATDLSPTTPVITIYGLCAPPKAGAKPTPQAECKTVVTRAEFEKLANALQPKMTPQVRRQLANQYPQIVYMSELARKRGLDKDPHFLEMLRFTRMDSSKSNWNVPSKTRPKTFPRLRSKTTSTRTPRISSRFPSCASLCQR